KSQTVPFRPSITPSVAPTLFGARAAAGCRAIPGRRTPSASSPSRRLLLLPRRLGSDQPADYLSHAPLLLRRPLLHEIAQLPRQQNLDSCCVVHTGEHTGTPG